MMDIREKIIDSLHWKEYMFIGQDNAIFEGSLTQESEEQITTSFLSIQLTTSRGCPECKGSRTNYNNFEDCPTCHGTGRQEVTKSIKDILEEYKNGL